MRPIFLSQRPVFLSPHPDDAVLSCGGSIYQLAENGHRPILVLTNRVRAVGRPRGRGR